MNQEIDYHSRYLKYKKKYLDLKSELDGGRGIGAMQSRLRRKPTTVVEREPEIVKVEPEIVDEKLPEELDSNPYVGWDNEPRFIPKFDDNPIKFEDIELKLFKKKIPEDSELKIFLTENKEKRLKWRIDKRSLKLKDLESELVRTKEHFFKFFYPWILKRIFEFSYIKSDAIVLMRGEYTFKTFPVDLNLTIFYNEGIEAKWTNRDGSIFDPKQLSYGLFGKVKEGKIDLNKINMQKFVKEYTQFLIDFQIKLNEVFEHWLKMIATQKDEDITAFLIKLKEMWNRSYMFYLSIKK